MSVLRGLILAKKYELLVGTNDYLFVIHGCIKWVSVERGFTVYRFFLLTILPEYRAWPQIPFSVSARISLILFLSTGFDDFSQYGLFYSL